MDFLTLQKELAAQVGLNYTISSQATLLKRWINTSQQIIFSLWDWPFLRSSNPLVVQTVPDYTTGTVATTAGSTTITFSTAPTDVNGSNVSVAGRFIQTSSSNDWYRITAHTSATTTATLEAAAINTDSAATFIVRKFYYSTSSAVDRILQIRQSIMPYQLTETGLEYFQSVNPDFLSNGTPRFFMMAGIDSSNYPQFRVWPNPDAVINLYIDYLKTATDLSSDSDVSIIPAKWHTSVLLEGAKVQAFSFDDDTRLANSQALFQQGIESMRQEYEESLNRHRVVLPIDEQPTGANLGYLPLPFNYPRGS